MGPFPVYAAGDLLNETFESYAPGTKPANWKIPAPPAAVEPAPDPYVVRAVVEQVDGIAGKALKLEKNGKSASSYNIEKTIPAGAAKMTMTYKVKADQTGAVFYLPTLKNGAVVIKFALYEGQFAYMKQGGTFWTPIAPYEAGVWYEVDVMADSEAGIFDLSIDGAPKLSREPWTAGVAPNGFYLGIYKDSVGSAYFDDFQISSYKPAIGVSFPQPAYGVAKGASVRLPLAFEPADATVRTASWSSDRPDIASVDANGVVTGVSPGTAVIAAQPLEPIPAATVTVNVYVVPITGITIAPVGSAVPVGSRHYLQAEIAPANHTDTRIVWGTDDPQVATVDEYGELTGVGPGTATVYAANADGTIRGETAVTVAPRTVWKELYVAPSGDDGSPGTEQAPFRTIRRAQEAVRQLTGAMAGDIVVLLREGTYTLDDTLRFGPDDSGRNGHFVTYRSYPGEEAVISGGRTITGWTEHDNVNGIYKAYVGGLNTRQLFVDGVRAVRARSEGGLTNPLKTADGYVSDDTFLAAWGDASELEFVYREQWTNPRVNVQSVGLAGGKAQIVMENPGWAAASNKGMTSATVPVYYENAYELIDRPGEWYYSRTDGYVYYKPRAWENLSAAEVVAPVLERLLDISGESADRPVRNLQFEGLRFRYSAWNRPSTSFGHSDAQNNHLRYPGKPDELPDAAIELELANTVHFKRNDFAKLGITAIRMQNGVQNGLIEGNRFYDISGGAINVGQPNSNDPDVYHSADKRKWMKNNDIVNNYIHDIGVDYMSAAAISAGFPVDMDISHNEIYNIPYSGTHIGYGWTKDFDPVTRNVNIRNNLIYDLMGMGLRDGGAFYSLGTSGATAEDKNVVAGNYIRNQMDIGAPLYADEGSAYWKYESNVIDLRESPPWHSSKRWAQAWAATIHDQEFVGNYTTESAYIDNGFDNVFRDTRVFPDADWPSEALAIIGNAGLQPSYLDLADGAVSRWTAEPVRLNVGETQPVALAAKDGKDRPLTLDTSRLYYSVQDASVASVDGEGKVTGLREGSTKVTIDIVNGSVLRTIEADVFVGETLSDIRLEGVAGNVAYAEQGATAALRAYGNTTFGNRVELDAVAFSSSNPAVASVTTDGVLTAREAGSAVLALSGTYKGTERKGYYHLKVGGGGTAEPYALRREIDDAGSWHVSPEGGNNVQSGDSRITIGTPNGGHAVYQGRQFGGELLDFKMTINASSSWYALQFGKQSETLGYSADDTYLAVVSAGGIELQRFNAGARTVIYGDIPGYPSLAGPAIPNTMLPFNEERRLQLGAVPEAGGVRLIMTVDGETVFDYLDTAVGAIRKPGYFGLIARNGTITLAKPDDAPVPVVGLALDGLSAMRTGETRSVSVVAVRDDGTVGFPSSGVSYASADPSIADIDDGGTVTAYRAGQTVISATYGAHTASHTLAVTEGPAPADATKPTWPAGAGLTADGNGTTKVELKWPAASDNVGVVRYEVRFDDNVLQTGSTGMTVKGLKKNNAYSFRVFALDAAGNRSDPLELTVETKKKPGKGHE
ncbi:Ig-like domain-containing protein [Paenibacillus flagellatus]|uniref:Ig-like domain-containing protein n=1 Tax=Paenibacillus flagellatus TaxID=2211139 RepID=UPI00130526D5|nr:Ig-like domain-containing protein [Paenibacillus flagellatus]